MFIILPYKWLTSEGAQKVKRYPRDMTGYGETPPDAKWPGGAKIAVQIVLNYEEGGENNTLHGDAASDSGVHLSSHTVVYTRTSFRLRNCRLR